MAGNVKNMFTKLIGILKCDRDIIRTVSKDKHSTRFGIMVCFLIGLTIAIKGAFAGHPFDEIIILLVSGTAGSLAQLFVGTAVIYSVAHVIEGKAIFSNILRPNSYELVLDFVRRIIALVAPALALPSVFAVALWGGVVSIAIVKNVYDSSWAKATAIISISFILYLLFWWLSYLAFINLLSLLLR